MTKINRGDLYGLRAEKYEALNATDVTDTDWAEIAPQTPFYLFTEMDMEAAEEYEKGYKVTDIMQVYSVGIATARDHFTIHWTVGDVWKTISDFVNLPIEEAREKYKLRKDVQDWKVAYAQDDIVSNGLNKSKIIPVHYRPFDMRYTYYTGRSRGFICRPRPEVMFHMFANRNLGIITSRLTKGEVFRHIQITRNITEVICMSPKTSNNGFLFPLYLYPSASEDGLELETPGEREPNLSPEFVESFLEAIGAERIANSPEVGERSAETDVIYPEDIFYYIYGVLHSPTYRERYAEFLKIDFPRIPLPKDYDSFDKLTTAGQELTDLHLLKDKEGWDWGGIGQRGDATDTTVGKVEYDDNNREIVFDIKKPPAEQVRVGPVPPEIWEFHIGGYQVLHKWLKDRKGRKVDLGDYVPIIIALKETNRLMKEDIDPVFRGMIGA